MKVTISADSTCDLGEQLVEQYGIRLAPLGVMAGETLYRDGVDITPAEIFRLAEEEKVLCQTTALNAYEYEEFFRGLREQGADEIVHINISQQFSVCYQNACRAAEKLGGVYVVDSRNLSTGSGHLALDAAMLAQEGLGGEEIAARLRVEAERVEASFVVDTMDYLRRGGRCSALEHLGAKLLRIKPCIEVVDGHMDVGRKYRGSLETCLHGYVRDRLEGRSDIDPARIFVTHSLCPAPIVEAVIEQVKAIVPFEEILETPAGCTVSNHCGPGTLGILFKRKLS